MAKTKKNVTTAEEEPAKDTGIDPCWKRHPEKPVLTCSVTIYLGGHQWAWHALITEQDEQQATDLDGLKRERLHHAYLALHEQVMEYLNG